jgi:transcriptional regulator with XRE-family HTH domain
MARPTTRRATDFGTRLAEARKAAGLTQAELAERLSVSQQMIDYYERRAKNPTADFIRKAAATLDVSVDQLLSHQVKNGRKPGPKSRLERQFEAISKLPPGEQELVSKLLERFTAGKPA